MNLVVRPLRRGLQEPFTRFVLLGAVIFAADHFLAGGARAPGDPDIVVTASRQAALQAAFRGERGRAPDAEELRAHIGQWVDEQVLYREALALGLDQRDAIVQRQLTQRMRFLIEDAQVLPEPSDAELQAWLDAHPERYGRAATVSFEHVFLSRGLQGAGLQKVAARTAERLAAEPARFAGLGDPFLAGQIVNDADRALLRREFGTGFAEALDELPEHRWSGPVPSGHGLHLVRITDRTAYRPARLDEVRERVRVDWRVARREALNREALDELRARYRIRIEEAG